MITTVFHRIIAGELPATKVFEDEHFLVIKDIHPAAKVHLLIIPKHYYKDVQSISAQDVDVMAHFVKVVQTVAQQCGIDKSGYRLITNVGRDGGQEIPYLHFHLIGGEPIGPLVAH